MFGHCDIVAVFMMQMESCFEIRAKIQTLSPTSCVFLDKSLPSPLWEMRALH